MVADKFQAVMLQLMSFISLMLLVSCGSGQGQSYRIRVEHPTDYTSHSDNIQEKQENIAVPTIEVPSGGDYAVLPVASRVPTILRAIFSPDPAQSVPYHLNDVVKYINDLPKNQRRELYEIYMSQDFQPFWVTHNKVNKRAITFRQVINKELYLSTPVKQLRINTIKGNKQSDLAQYEVFFTLDIIKKMNLIRNGLTSLDGLYGVTERAYHHNIDLKKAFALIAANNIENLQSYIRPQHPFYGPMLMEMMRVERLQNVKDNPIRTNVTLKKGMSGRAVQQLLHKLKISGDIAQSYQTYIYDDAIKNAVMQFQRRNGATVDGNVGAQTRRMLNRSRIDFIRMLLVNFERIRKAPAMSTNQYIRVNVPEYRARYYEHHTQTTDMSVIVGREERATPIFYDKMSYIEFNPYWNVPHRLAVEDILPKIKRNPAYLRQKNFKIFSGSKQINSRMVNWRNITKYNFRYRLQQQPGARNALGTVKFMFPNKYAVYLHDTPAKSLFHRINKSQSSGCIRVSDPVTLASKLLKYKMSRAQVKAIFRSKKNRQVAISPKIDIALEYLTVSPMLSGKIRYNKDIYNFDKKLYNQIIYDMSQYNL